MLFLIAFILLEITVLILFYTVFKQQSNIEKQERLTNYSIEKYHLSEKKRIENLEKISKIEKLFNSCITYDAETLTRKIKAILSDTAKHA